MTNATKVIVGLAVGALVGGLAFLLGHTLGGNAPQPSDQASTDQSFGSTVQPNVPWFTNGYKVGTDQNLRQTGVLTIPVAQNQVSVRNLTGQTIYVRYGNAQMVGTASSTIALYVGTTSAATVTNVFAAATAPFWAQFIDGDSVATGTVASVISDNITNHKSTYPATLAVANNQYFTAMVTAQCISATAGQCETATSSRRGWTTITIPYEYYYQSPN